MEWYWWALIAVAIVSFVFLKVKVGGFSLIGLAFSSLFKDLSSWFFSMVLLLSINMLPVISFSEPSFSPLWMILIPSYPMLFAFERILFGISGSNLSAVLTVAGWSIGSYLLSRMMVNRFLLSKGRH